MCVESKINTRVDEKKRVNNVRNVKLSGTRLKLRSLLTALDRKELLTVGGTICSVKRFRKLEEGNFVALANNIQNEHETNKVCHKLIHLKSLPRTEGRIEKSTGPQSP